MEDEKILQLYFARDEEALRQTQVCYGGRLLTLAQNIVRNREDAEESVNDTYLAAWQTIPPKKPNFFLAYLSKICRNFAFGKLDWQQAAKRRAEVVTLSQEMEQCIPDKAREAELESREIARAVNDFLRGLTPENRGLFLRRYWYCDTIEEIARRYGMGQSKVKMRLRRIRQQLAAYLEQEGIFL